MQDKTYCNYCGHVIKDDEYLQIGNLLFCNAGCHAGYVYLHTCGEV